MLSLGHAHRTYPSSNQVAMPSANEKEHRPAQGRNIEVCLGLLSAIGIATGLITAFKLATFDLVAISWKRVCQIERGQDRQESKEVHESTRGLLAQIHLIEVALVSLGLFVQRSLIV